jgi:hypothetical protein
MKIETENSLVLAYGVSAWIAGCDGFRWPPGKKWHDVCAYCHGPLRDEGQFHSNTHTILLPPHGSRTLGGCVGCGSKRAEIDRSAFRYHDNRRWYKPLRASPGVGCFLHVATCRLCGWWYVVERGQEASGGDPMVYHGILRSFDVSSADIPISALQSELPRHFEKIRFPHPNRMEDLVGRILAGVWDCDVKQLGYTRDGGIDLVLLISDTPVAVQIKRRQRKGATEGVHGVREFLGAGVLEGYTRLLYVSTASQFSREAQELARRAVEKELVVAYQLFDVSVLRTLLEAAHTETNWISAIKEVRPPKGTGRMPQTGDPYEFVQSRKAA